MDILGVQNTTLFGLQKDYVWRMKNDSSLNILTVVFDDLFAMMTFWMAYSSPVQLDNIIGDQWN